MFISQALFQPSYLSSPLSVSPHSSLADFLTYRSVVLRVSVALVEQQTKDNLGKKGFVSGYSSTSLREFGQDPETGNKVRGHEGVMFTDGLHPMPCSA